jgi:hypothetical protein
MVGVRSMLARVQRLEHAKVSPLLRLIGTPEEFAAKVQAGVDAGIYDPRDMVQVVPGVLSRSRNGYWE